MFFSYKAPILNHPLNCKDFCAGNHGTEYRKDKSEDTGIRRIRSSHTSLIANAKHVFLELTNQCNFRCHFCPLAISKRPPEHMDTELAKDLIKQLHEAGYENNLYFHLLGEPLLHPDIFEILEFASKKTPRSVLFTNGSLLTWKNIESVFDASPYELMISMQLTDEQTFSLRGSSISWGQYALRIKDTTHYKLTHNTTTLLRISVGIRKEDSVYPQDDYFPNVSPSELRKNILDLFSDIPCLDPLQIEEMLNTVPIPFQGKLELAPGVSVSIKQIGNWRRLYTDKEVKEGYCPHFGREFGILSNGSLVYCHLDYDGKTAFANARNNRLRDIFQKTDLQREIEEFLIMGKVAKGCRHCVVSGKPKRKEEA